MNPRVKTDFSRQTIERHEQKLGAAHFAVLMRFLAADGNYVAIAADLDVRVGTVKSRLNRARRKLSALVAKEVHPNGAPKYAPDGTMLDDVGNRSVFDDVDE